MSLKVSLLLVLCICTKTQSEQPGPEDPGLIQRVYPNYDAIKGLVCYQCHSVTTELQPLCDKTIFRLSTRLEKYNMSLQCPSYQGAYCFTKIVKLHHRHVETFRGCSGDKDKNGNLLKTGCMQTKKQLLCLCDKKFCNRGENYLSALLLTVLTVVILAL